MHARVRVNVCACVCVCVCVCARACPRNSSNMDIASGFSFTPLVRAYRAAGSFHRFLWCPFSILSSAASGRVAVAWLWHYLAQLWRLAAILLPQVRVWSRRFHGRDVTCVGSSWHRPGPGQRMVASAVFWCCRPVTWRVGGLGWSSISVRKTF